MVKTPYHTFERKKKTTERHKVFSISTVNQSTLHVLDVIFFQTLILLLGYD